MDFIKHFFGMRIRVVFILMMGFFVSSNFAKAATFKKSEILLKMLSDAYESGNYRVGLNRSKDLKPAIETEEGIQSITIAHVHAWKAILYASLSKFDKYKVELDSAKSLLVSYPKDSTNCQEAFLTVVKAEIIYGNYQEALRIIQEVQGFSSENKFLYYSFAHQKGICNSKIGYLLDAEPELKESRKVVDALEQDTTIQFKLLRTKLLFLHFDVLFEMGEFQTCFHLITENKLWIKESFRYQHGVQGEMYLRHARYLAYKRHYSEANVMYRKAYSYGMRYYALYAPFFTTLQHERVDNLLHQKKNPEANYWKNDLDVRIVSYYGKQSVPYLDHKIREVEKSCFNGDWTTAESNLTSYINRNKNYPEDHIGKIKIKQLKYRIQLQLGKVKQADSTLAEIVQLAELKFGSLSPNFHLQKLEYLRFLYTYTNNIQGLDVAYKESLEGVLKNHLSKTHKDYYINAFGLIDLYNLNEQYELANKTIEIYLNEIDKNAKSVRSQALILSSETKTLMGDYNTSLIHIKEALWKLKNEKHVDEKLIYAEGFRSEALLFKETGNFIGAEIAYNSSDKLFSDQLVSVHKTPIRDIAWLHIHKGKYRKTAKLLKEELNRAKNSVGESHYSNINLLLNLSEINMQLGDFSLAEENLRQAKSISEQVFGSHSEHYAKVLLTYKKFYEAIGDFQKSEEYAQSAINILASKFGNNHIKTALPKSELALAIGLNHKEFQAKTNDITTLQLKRKCDSLLVDAEHIIHSAIGNDNPLYAVLLENTGKYNLIVQNLTKSSANISAARTIWTKTLGEPNVHTAHLDYLLGEIAYFDSAYTSALQYFIQSKDAYKTLFGTHHPDYVESLGMISRMYFIEKNIKEAVLTSEEVVEKSLSYIHTIFPSLSERGKANYWAKVKEHFEFFNTLAFTQSKTYPNLIGKAFDINLQTKAILLNSSLKTKNFIMQSGDTVLINAFTTWMDKKELLITGVSMEHNERKKEGLDLLQLENEIENLEQYLSLQAVGFNDLKTNAKVYKWQDLSAVLDKNDQVIEIIAFRLFEHRFSDSIWYAIMGVNNSTKTNPSHRVLTNGNFMHREGIAYYRNCLKFNIADNYSYTTFWQPIEAMAAKNGKTFISFDGVYNRLNLETILLPNKDLVLNNYQIIPIGTSRDLLEKSSDNLTTETGNSAFFLGNPSFYSPDYKGLRSWSQLQGTENEVLQLSSFLKTQNWNTEIFKNDNATEQVVKNLHSPAVFHIATHGFYIEEETENNINKVISNAASNPLLRSGLLLQNGGELYEGAKAYEFNRTDGILTAYEAMNLDLGHTDLVVLSACETGHGKVELGEGVFGLQRSFVVAGARNIIISLFKVSDEVTTELMTSFYKNWNQSHNKKEAFVQAKKEILAKYNNAIYWGAFVMIGVE